MTKEKGDKEGATQGGPAKGRAPRLRKVPVRSAAPHPGERLVRLEIHEKGALERILVTSYHTCGDKRYEIDKNQTWTQEELPW